MRLYRVHPHLPSAAPNDWGGALYVPTGGHGRFDNAKLYRAFYASTTPVAAIIERFGDLDEWTRDTFLTPALKPGAAPLSLALSTYDADVAVIDLADVAALQTCSVERAPDVVTRDRTRTQALARRIFLQRDKLRAGDGIAWWSYYDPDLTNVMFWTREHVHVIETQPLSVDNTHVVDAARRFHRQLVR